MSAVPVWYTNLDLDVLIYLDMVLGLKSLSTTAWNFPLWWWSIFVSLCCHNCRIWVKSYSCREEAHVLPAAASLISSPAWAITCPAATHAIRVTAVSLRPSVTAVAWITLASTNMHSAKFYSEIIYLSLQNVYVDSVNIQPHAIYRQVCYNIMVNNV